MVKFIVMIMIATSGLLANTICIDPGHGGKDIGAPGIDGGAYPNEADFVLEIGNLAVDMLKKQGIKVISTRTDDTYVSLANRVAQANSNNVDIFVAIHLNSDIKPSAHGTETYAYSETSKGSHLATLIQNNLVEQLGRKNRGVKYKSYYVIAHTKMPAALSEGLFLSNQEEFEIISEQENRYRHAEAVAEAVFTYFEIDVEEPEEEIEDEIEEEVEEYDTDDTEYETDEIVDTIEDEYETIIDDETYEKIDEDLFKENQNGEIQSDANTGCSLYQI
jgi:N-acetylmuramoyl-L-alanine amidase